MIGEYEEEVPRTQSEMAEDFRQSLQWKKLYEKWDKAGRLCRCGNPITLEDAFWFGLCAECRYQVAPF